VLFFLYIILQTVFGLPRQNAEPEERIVSKETRTISDLVNAISEEMKRLDYKPTVLKQYQIVWNKLCKRVGLRPANDFDMEFGMKFLDEAMRAHPKHLNENSKHRWIKAIYTLADFKRTGILSLRRERRGFVFSEVAKSAFQQFTAHQSAIGLSEAHIRDTCLYLERFSKYLEQQCLENIAGLDTRHVQGFVNSLAIYELPTIYHTTCVLRRALRYLYAQGIITTDLSTVVPKLRRYGNDSRQNGPFGELPHPHYSWCIFQRHCLSAT
jgi:integrase/recombinase XerD